MTLVYLVAGEQSGDVLGARLMQALRAKHPQLEFAGIGGTQMAAQGLASLFPVDELALMGFLEVLPRLARLRRRLAEAAADIAARRPSAVVTIDSPGFNLQLLRAITPTGIRRVHYVAPQAWAWRESRVRHYPGLWDRLLCLLPFEPAFFARYNLPACFVGHPVLESGAEQGDGARFRSRHGLPQSARIITLMPGSRRSETARLLPIMGAALQRIPGITPVLPVASGVADAVRTGTKHWPVPPILVTSTQDKYDAFAASSAALTKSGTSTLELAMAGTPMLVAYRVNPLSAALARRMIKVKWASILNLLSEREVIPELLQEACTPTKLAEALKHLLDNPDAAAAQRTACQVALEALRPPAGTPSEAAAAAVLELLDQP
jgi:lipid-A-disaccharide synthase